MDSFPSCDSAAMQGSIPTDTVATVRERLVARELLEQECHTHGGLDIELLPCPRTKP